MTEAERAAVVGTYENRWPMDVFVSDGRLFLRRFGAELPVTRIGENRYSVTPDGGKPQEFLIVPAENGRPGYMQMFIWVFRKAEPSLSNENRGSAPPPAPSATRTVPL